MSKTKTEYLAVCTRLSGKRFNPVQRFEGRDKKTVPTEKQAREYIERAVKEYATDKNPRNAIASATIQKREVTEWEPVDEIKATAEEKTATQETEKPKVPEKKRPSLAGVKPPRLQRKESDEQEGVATA